MEYDANGNITVLSRYGTYGGEFGQTDFLQMSYAGKRLDRMHGLDRYDFGARQYDPVYGRFAGIDPLCEKYPHLSPYAYCGNDPVNFVDPDGRDYFVIINEMNKTITITANYYAMSEDMDALNHALSFWNGLSYEIDGYKVGFDLKAMEVTKDDLNKINDNMQYLDKKHALSYILNKEYAEDINLLLSNQRHNNIFFTSDIPDNNTNGYTKRNIIGIDSNMAYELTGSHEVGHTLGLEHDDLGLMTSESSSKYRTPTISVNQIKTIIHKAYNSHQYLNDNNVTFGIGFLRFTKYRPYEK